MVIATPDTTETHRPGLTTFYIMAKQKYNQQEKQAIERHLQWCIDSFETNLQSYTDLPKATRTKFVVGQIRYWKNGLGAYRWALRMLQAFGKGSHHATTENHGTIEGSFIEGGGEDRSPTDTSKSVDDDPAEN